MLSRRLLAALLPAAAVFMAVAAPASFASDAANPKVIAEVSRYLKAIQFGETFLGGVRKANSAQGQGSPFLDRILLASAEEIEATVAPAFANHVSLPQARAMADFFSSPLGQKATSKGQKQLTAAETRELEKFGATAAGELSVTLTTDPAIRKEYLALLQAKYGQ